MKKYIKITKPVFELRTTKTGIKNAQNIIDLKIYIILKYQHYIQKRTQLQFI